MKRVCVCVCVCVRDCGCTRLEWYMCMSVVEAGAHFFLSQKRGSLPYTLFSQNDFYFSFSGLYTLNIARAIKFCVTT